MSKTAFDATGYMLVPTEPTEAMLKAACNDGVLVDGKPVWKRSLDFQAKWKYQAMLEAYKLETQETKLETREQAHKRSKEQTKDA